MAGGITGSDALRDAVERALKASGMELLNRPAALYATLTDLVAPDSAEMRALWIALASAGDQRLLSGLAALDGTSSPRDVEACIKRIANMLTSDYVLNETVAQACAQGLGQGVARYLGLTAPAKTGRAAGAQGGGQATARKDARKGAGKTGGQTSATGQGNGSGNAGAAEKAKAAGAVGVFAIPDYNRYVDVDASVLLQGGTATVDIQPRHYDPETGKRKNRSEPKVAYTVNVKAGNATWRTIRLAGEGYYTDGGLRGDLVIHVRKKKDSDAATTPTDGFVAQTGVADEWVAEQRTEERVAQEPPASTNDKHGLLDGVLGALIMILVSVFLVLFLVVEFGLDPAVATLGVFGLWVALSLL